MAKKRISKNKNKISSNKNKSNKKKNNKKKLLLLLLLLLLLIGGTVYLIVRGNSKPKAAVGINGVSGSQQASENIQPSSGGEQPNADNSNANTSTTTNKSTSSGSSGSSSSSTPTPAPAPAFAVTGVNMSVNTTNLVTANPADFFRFTAAITTNGAGTVTYKWMRNPAIIAVNQNLVFNGAGTQYVTYDWSADSCVVPEVFQRSMYMQIFSPNSTSSNTVNVTLDCL